jgi:hypothetical protein
MKTPSQLGIGSPAAICGHNLAEAGVFEKGKIGRNAESGVTGKKLPPIRKKS